MSLHRPTVRFTPLPKRGEIVQRALDRLEGRVYLEIGVQSGVCFFKVRAGKKTFGFNAATETYGDLVEMGVIDPRKVVRTSLQNAASVSTLLLTTEAVITEIPEKKPPAPGGGGMDDMY